MGLWDTILSDASKAVTATENAVSSFVASQPARLQNVVATIGAAVTGSVQSNTGIKSVDKILSTVASHPFIDAGVVAVGIGAATGTGIGRLIPGSTPTTNPIIAKTIIQPAAAVQNAVSTAANAVKNTISKGTAAVQKSSGAINTATAAAAVKQAVQAPPTPAVIKVAPSSSAPPSIPPPPTAPTSIMASTDWDLWYKLHAKRYQDVLDAQAAAKATDQEAQKQYQLQLDQYNALVASQASQIPAPQPVQDASPVTLEGVADTAPQATPISASSKTRVISSGKKKKSSTKRSKASSTKRKSRSARLALTSSERKGRFGTAKQFKRKGGKTVKYTKNGQPYITLANGKARFVKR